MLSCHRSRAVPHTRYRTSRPRRSPFRTSDRGRGVAQPRRDHLTRTRRKLGDRGRAVTRAAILQVDGHPDPSACDGDLLRASAHLDLLHDLARAGIDARNGAVATVRHLADIREMFVHDPDLGASGAGWRTERRALTPPQPDGHATPSDTLRQGASSAMFIRPREPGPRGCLRVDGPAINVAAISRHPRARGGRSVQDSRRKSRVR
jgi:hypothetical protein